MKLKLYFSFLLLFILLFISCKKDKVEPAPLEYQPLVAPCSIAETEYDIDSIYYGPSIYHLEAKFRIKFFDTSSNGNVIRWIEYGFNRIPTTGKYTMNYQIDTNNIVNANQIAFALDSGSFLWRSEHTEFNEMFIDKNTQELIISYCNISNSAVNFNVLDMCYVGNKPISYKTRVQL